VQVKLYFVPPLVSSESALSDERTNETSSFACDTLAGACNEALTSDTDDDDEDYDACNPTVHV
jgi:hypothetical protein